MTSSLSSRCVLSAFAAAVLLLLLTAAPTRAASPLWNQHATTATTITSANAPTLQRAWSLRTRGPVTATPLVYGRSLIVADWSGRVWRLSRSTGHVIWMRKLGSPRLSWPWHGFVGTGALSGRWLVEASAEGRVWGMDAKTGRVMWKRRLSDGRYEGSTTDIAICRGAVYVGLSSVDEPLSGIIPGFTFTSRGAVLSLDLHTGLRWWRTYTTPVDSTGGAVWTSFAHDPDTELLFFTVDHVTSGTPGDLNDSVTCLDGKDGRFMWSTRLAADHELAAGEQVLAEDEFGAGPQLFKAVVNGSTHKLVGVGQRSGTYWTLQAGTGRPMLYARVGSGPVGIGGEAAFAGDRVIVWSDAGWSEGEPAAAKPAVVRALDTDTLQTIWTASTSPAAMNGAAGLVANDVYVCGDLTGTVRAYATSDGALLWTGHTKGGAAVGGSPWASGGLLLVPAGLRVGEHAKPAGVTAFRVR